MPPDQQLSCLKSTGQNPQIRFDIFTETPEWFFRESDSPFQKSISTASDVGIVQISPMEMDIQTTGNGFQIFYPKSNRKHTVSAIS